MCFFFVLFVFFFLILRRGLIDLCGWLVTTAESVCTTVHTVRSKKKKMIIFSNCGVFDFGRKSVRIYSFDFLTIIYNIYMRVYFRDYYYTIYWYQYIIIMYTCIRLTEFIIIIFYDLLYGKKK